MSLSDKYNSRAAALYRDKVSWALSDAMYRAWGMGTGGRGRVE